MRAAGVLMAIVLVPVLAAGCQPASPPPTPLPTKEKTIDRVKSDLDRAMKQAEEIRREAEDPSKKGS